MKLVRYANKPLISNIAWKNISTERKKWKVKSKVLFHKLFKWHQTNPNRITGLVKQKSNHCQNCVFERKKLEFRNNTWPIQMHSVEVWINNRKIVSLNTCPIESMFELVSCSGTYKTNKTTVSHQFWSDAKLTLDDSSNSEYYAVHLFEWDSY